jgi:hypothetical protein
MDQAARVERPQVADPERELDQERHHRAGGGDVDPEPDRFVAAHGGTALVGVGKRVSIIPDPRR